MKTYKICGFCSLHQGAQVREFELANGTKIPAIWVGEKGRGREVGLMPVKNIILKPGTFETVHNLSVSQTLSGKPCFVAGREEKKDEKNYILVAEWESGFRGSGSNYVALKGIDSFLAWNQAFQTWNNKYSDEEKARIWKECQEWQGLFSYVYLPGGEKKAWITESEICFIREEEKKYSELSRELTLKIMKENGINFVESEKIPEIERDYILRSPVKKEWAEKNYQKEIKTLTTGNKAQGAAGRAGNSEQYMFQVPFETVFIYKKEGRTYGDENMYVYYISENEFIGLPYSEFLAWIDSKE